ncbi:MAG: hypothetical protein A2Z16_01845 [Chloroflexi bacterium RBG_16_54_18]|nr:MAG: hypothetical protein A2Z16_01845 [Chloroflexi bacterium RBG_16_54_18]
MAPAVTTSFNSPITVTVPYTDTNILHFDESQLAIYLWSEAIDDWEQLPTTVDTTLNTATAQTLDIGHFDLQAPLLCPGDNTEPSDSYNSATNMFTNNTLVSNLFDIPEDKDWQRFEAKTNWQYTIQTNNLASGVDTVIELYDLDGLTELASDDDSGGGLASKLVWQAPNDGTYFIRLLPKPGSLYGCSASYEIVALGETLIYMPLIVR